MATYQNMAPKPLHQEEPNYPPELVMGAKLTTYLNKHILGTVTLTRFLGFQSFLNFDIFHTSTEKPKKPKLVERGTKLQ